MESLNYEYEVEGNQVVFTNDAKEIIYTAKCITDPKFKGLCWRWINREGVTQRHTFEQLKYVVLADYYLFLAKDA